MSSVERVSEVTVREEEGEEEDVLVVDCGRNFGAGCLAASGGGGEREGGGELPRRKEGRKERRPWLWRRKRRRKQEEEEDRLPPSLSPSLPTGSLAAAGK